MDSAREGGADLSTHAAINRTPVRDSAREGGADLSNPMMLPDDFDDRLRPRGRGGFKHIKYVLDPRPYSDSAREGGADLSLLDEGEMVT